MGLKSNDILVLYKRILLVEKIKNIEINVHGNKFWYDKKGIYNREGNPVMIAYINNEYKTFFPESQTFQIYWDKSSKHDICYIYEQLLDEHTGKVKNIYHSCIHYLNGVPKVDSE